MKIALCGKAKYKNPKKRNFIVRFSNGIKLLFDFCHGPELIQGLKLLAGDGKTYVALNIIGLFIRTSPWIPNGSLSTTSLFRVDQLAKRKFRFYYTQTPVFLRLTANFVIRSEQARQLFDVLIGRAQISSHKTARASNVTIKVNIILFI